MAPHVLGILNVTPDSFSDGGRFATTDAAIAHGHIMLDQGADMIDVGGESTRPGAVPPDVDTELGRVIPVIEALAGRCRLSIDTRRAEVAEAAVAAGATIINDVGAGLGSVAAELGVGWIACHAPDDPRTMQDNPRYGDVVVDVVDALDRAARAAKQSGVSELWIDPGFGFGKTVEHNLALLAHLDAFVATGWPVAVGTSRKSMLGTLLARSDRSPDPVGQPVVIDERLIGSVATATWALTCGVELIRVHDVGEARQAVTVYTGEPRSRSA